MAGQIHAMIDRIISQKARGNQIIASSVRTKMILKGIPVDKYTAMSPDDPAILQKLKEVAKEFGIVV